MEAGAGEVSVRNRVRILSFVRAVFGGSDLLHSQQILAVVCGGANHPPDLPLIKFPTESRLNYAFSLAMHAYALRRASGHPRSAACSTDTEPKM